jgi:nucleoside-triphosphatase THEP1
MARKKTTIVETEEGVVESETTEVDGVVTEDVYMSKYDKKIDIKIEDLETRLTETELTLSKLIGFLNGKFPIEL